MLSRLSGFLRRGKLKPVADALWMSKVRYGIALFSDTQTSECETKSKITKDLQVAQNSLLHLLLGKRRTDRISVKNMLTELNMSSVNQLSAETVLYETWKAMNVPGHPLSYMFDKKCSDASKICTRSTQRGDLIEFGHSKSFKNRASKLYNKVDSQVRLTTVSSRLQHS